MYKHIHIGIRKIKRGMTQNFCITSSVKQNWIQSFKVEEEDEEQEAANKLYYYIFHVLFGFNTKSKLFTVQCVSFNFSLQHLIHI